MKKVNLSTLQNQVDGLATLVCHLVLLDLVPLKEKPHLLSENIWLAENKIFKPISKFQLNDIT